MQFKVKNYQLGHVVVPATDSQLKFLGFQIEDLKEKSLGLVIDNAKNRQLCYFPELAKTLWMNNSEIKDVLIESKNTEQSLQKNFEALIPDYSNASGLSNIWLLNFLAKTLPVHCILEVEQGSLWEMLDDDETKSYQEKFPDNKADQSVFRFSLGLEKLNSDEWNQLIQTLDKRLVWHELYPSGMHKFEARLFLKKI